MIDFGKRFVEVEKILNYLPKDSFNKIPNDVVKYIKNKKDKAYKWEYDESKELKEQNVSDDTIAILSYLNMKYLLNKEQREFMEKLHHLYEKKKYV